MSLRSVLFSFKLRPNQTLSETTVETVLKQEFDTISLTGRFQLSEGSVVFYSTSDNRLMITMRLYSRHRLVSLIAEECVDCETQASTVEQRDKYLLKDLMPDILRSKIQSALDVSRVEALPVLRRATPLPRYWISSDERILEYDFEETLFEVKSKHQTIQILRSPSLGACLVLDGDPQLSDADLAYTRALMRFGDISYAGKEVLICGGGDGALLHELLKEGPKFVTMIDIDALVMDACRRHLRRACGQALDTFKGDNYQVIVGDCVEHMEQYLQNGRSFDYVINDLTDIPINKNESRLSFLKSGAVYWKLFERILNLGVQLVRGDGYYLNHAIGIGCKAALEGYEQLLRELPVKVEYSRHTAYVPSFMEEWVFYQIWKV